ncbi:MAG: AAA family ATPase [Candidatus Omnitrophica bacterium]|nr:AAA family ATPase [Candidatus Omnitrophota bacterium]
MYQQYWGLTDKPFENTADPRFLYYSPQHQEAFSRLTYAINEQKGAALLTGVFGCGKTVVAQAVLLSLSKGKFETAFVINPQLSHIELLREIVYDLGVKDNLPTLKTDIMHRLDEMLHNNMDNGKNTVVIIDEAHLINDVLIFEELRLLLNFQYKNKFLITLILLGQPELKDKINNIKQFQQRIAVKHHLAGLSYQETQEYIQYRLKVSGTQKQIFQGSAIRLIYEQSGGIPRRINQICDMALLIGMGRKQESITDQAISEVIEDVEA